MSAEFVKSFKIKRLTENLPTWKVGVYNASLYSDGNVVIHNPSKNYPKREWSIHRTCFGEDWAYYSEEAHDIQKPSSVQTPDESVRTLADVMIRLDAKGLFNLKEEADKAVSLLMDEIETRKSFGVVIRHQVSFKGTALLIASELKSRGFHVISTNIDIVTFCAISRG